MGADGTDPELAQQLAAMADLPAGCLGRAYLDFYERNGFSLPGSEATATAYFVGHDMNHVIAGYEPTGPEEIALSACLLAMNDDEANRFGLLGSLLVHEAGVLRAEGFVPKEATLARPGATELLGEAFERGAQCTADFSHAVHRRGARPIRRRAPRIAAQAGILGASAPGFSTRCE